MTEEAVTDPTAAPPAPLLPSQHNSSGNDDDNTRLRRLAPLLPRGPMTANSNQAGAPGSAAPAAPANSAINSPANTNPALNNPPPPPAGTAPPVSPLPTPGAAPTDAAGQTNPQSAAADPQSESPDAAEDAAQNAKPPINPGQAVNMATGLAAPAVTAALGIPSALLGAGMGLLAPFAQILQQFGQGSPSMPSSGGFPSGVMDGLGSMDALSGMSGSPGDAYQSEIGDQSNQAQALDHLEKNLRKTLDDSAANSTMGRDKVQQIISQVKSNLQALGPIANTPTGQLGVLSAITQGLQQAGAVLSQAVGKDALNAGTVKKMSLDYLKDLQSGPNDQNRQEMPAGGPQRWAMEALRANGITDPRAIANWLPGLMTMGRRESGHNPFAQNNWDSNAAKGTPSKGWMQTIQSTFDSHWRPGTSRNIFDPVSNAAAAIHYVMTRYHVSADGSDLMAKVQQANPNAAPKGY